MSDYESTESIVERVALIQSVMVANSILTVLVEKGLLTVEDVERAQQLSRDQQAGITEEVEKVLCR